ncbi:metallophosphoesterase [Rhodohalobacter sp. SW132]|uniref:metallophosphoesterase n=1 Tax=Rhodohalobacter sp. SW132 TaxID=2293433 RepID=UPI000E26D53A|nr:metallophosphoesterase [Rhodohalobacter sp. SW132]REL24887.1 metallophosphoesterase [Rhodohalobacter sp. SW132]
MKIGICSDSHDHVEHIKKAADVFRQREVEKVIHAGDYCSPFTIPLFEGLPLEGIFGNNDGDRFTLMKKFDEINAVLHGDFFSFEADRTKIAVYHGTYEELTKSLEKSGMYDVVITGHTHMPGVETVGDVISINPGSVNGFDDDAMIAFLDTDTQHVEFIEL